MNKQYSHGSSLPRRGARALASAAPPRRPMRETQRQGGAGDEGVVQGARPGGPRPPRPGRDAEGLHASTRPRRRPRTSPRRSRRSTSRSIKWPADGKYMGDWKNGERIAQEGRGKQFSDDPKGPSAATATRATSWRRRRSRTARSARRCTSSARSAATTTRSASTRTARSSTPRPTARARNMPRFGHSQILTEAQIKDLVALLMDPESPVNK